MHVSFFFAAKKEGKKPQWGNAHRFINPLRSTARIAKPVSSASGIRLRFAPPNPFRYGTHYSLLIWGSVKRVIIVVPLYQHLPRSFHPKPGESFILFGASKKVCDVSGTTLWASGAILFSATVKNHENPLIRQIKVQDNKIGFHICGVSKAWNAEKSHKITITANHIITKITVLIHQ
jgi:hypothetical protein